MSDAESLISFISQTTGEKNLRVEENLGEGFVRLRVSEAERRQAKDDIQQVEDIVVEMLRNARDAHAKNIYIATQKEGALRSLLFFDDGDGVPHELWGRIFDARVTSKLESAHMDSYGIHGRGMALFSIKENVVDARVVASGKDLGTGFKVVADCAVLREKADQSTWPKLGQNEEDELCCVQGPHNIIRSAAEFALQERSECRVYLGSLSDIAATMYVVAQSELSPEKLFANDDALGLPVPYRLGFATDAQEFVRIAASIGIDMSERTAQRIAAGQIAPLEDMASVLLRAHKPAKVSRAIDLSKDMRGLRVSKEDLNEFSDDLQAAFAKLAERYYLELNEQPHIKVSKNRISVVFDCSNTQ